MIQTLFGSTEEKKTGFFDRMKQAVTRTRENLAESIEDVVSFGREIDRSTLDELEGILIGADLGTATTEEVLGKLRDKAGRRQIKDVQELKRLLKEELLAILNAVNTRPVQKVEGTPEVILVVGVNGTGKTTTIGKLSQVFRSEGKTVLLCAADTFRAAAIDQLEIWGQRTGTEVIKTKPGGDPAAVLFDALQAASARKTDYVIVDTAGRLHTKTSALSEWARRQAICCHSIRRNLWIRCSSEDCRVAVRQTPFAPAQPHGIVTWLAPPEATDAGGSLRVQVRPAPPGT